MRLLWSSCLCGIVLAGCTSAVAEGGSSTGDVGSSGSEPMAEDSTSSEPAPTTEDSTGPGPSTTTSDAEPTTDAVDPSTGFDSTTSSGDASSGDPEDESSGTTTGVPLPAGCEDHLELEVSALSVQLGDLGWQPGDPITVEFSLFNAGQADDNNYPSVYVEADAQGVDTEQPIFTWFAIFAGQTYDGALVFSSPASLRSGSEIEFTAHVATLNDPCPGIGTRTVTMTVP